MNIIKNIILTIILLPIGIMASASTTNLTAGSSWAEILMSPNIVVKDTGINVGGLNTSIFFVNESNGVLSTKEPIDIGYYETISTNGENDKEKFIKTGEEIKKGSVVIAQPIYKTTEINRSKDEYKFIGYELKEQKLTRNLPVYYVKENNNGNRTERYLFSKLYEVKSK